ncbi:MAG TPA: 50S ribosomal protein L31e [Candidatus Limnocylindrales bacterium]|nr:50S ribosomal protein L31e [Candidatus Limnocylindrales bacterium]
MVVEDEEAQKAEGAEEELEAVPEEEGVKEETVVEEKPKEEALAEEKPAEEAEEEAVPSRKKKEEEEIVEERTYTIPLQKALVRPPKKRAPRAMELIRVFVTKHMKLEMKVSEEEEEEELPQLVISTEVNEKVWGRGIEKPPRRIRVRAAKDKDGNVTVYLAEAA